MQKIDKFADFGRKIVAIGRNYSEHAKELSNPVPSKPFYFLKPTSSYLKEGSAIRVPLGSDVHHEVELGVVIGKKGFNISESDAMDYVAGYALSLDMTARDAQSAAKEKRLPWSMAKGCDTFAPIGPFIPCDRVSDPHNLDIWLKVNDEMKQNGNTKDMIFRIPALISFISQSMTLEEGDLIMTGTPSGVGPVQPGDIITCGLSDLSELRFLVESGIALP